MPYDFNNTIRLSDVSNSALLALTNELSAYDRDRLSAIRQKWNFYEGYMWEDIVSDDKPQITENYCRVFVNKFVAFEFGEGFIVKMHDKMLNKPVYMGEMTALDYLIGVWKQNSQFKFCLELGQSKSITGDGWVMVSYLKNGTFDDPYEEYPVGKIWVRVLPTAYVFPEYDQHDKEKLIKVTLQYPIEVTETSTVLSREKVRTVLFKQVWTKDYVEEYIGKEQTKKVPNKYGIIPIRQIKNFPIVGKTEGLSDLEDIIPLNTELNLKKSDVSEIIDYHSAPITVVFGARIDNIQKGANKVWGGLPKDGKVQNLELTGDLTASVSYIAGVKTAMHEIGCVPEGSLGGEQHISNTSGVALQYANMPLIEKTKVKRSSTSEGLQEINKMILLISLKENMIEIPSDIKASDFFYNEVTLPDTLPKDTMIELQNISTEMKLGLENRKGAMERLGREDIESKIVEIDKERKENPELFGIVNDIGAENPNSGVMNGSTPLEVARKETTGENGKNSGKSDL